MIFNNPKLKLTREAHQQFLRATGTDCSRAKQNQTLSTLAHGGGQAPTEAPLPDSLRPAPGAEWKAACGTGWFTKPGIHSLYLPALTAVLSPPFSVTTEPAPHQPSKTHTTF